MEELKKQVRRAQRRMGLQRFVGVLGWCWFGTANAAASRDSPNWVRLSRRLAEGRPPG